MDSPKTSTPSTSSSLERISHIELLFYQATTLHWQQHSWSNLEQQNWYYIQHFHRIQDHFSNHWKVCQKPHQCIRRHAKCILNTFSSTFEQIENESHIYNNVVDPRDTSTFTSKTTTDRGSSDKGNQSNDLIYNFIK